MALLQDIRPKSSNTPSPEDASLKLHAHHLSRGYITQKKNGQNTPIALNVPLIPSQKTQVYNGYMCGIVALNQLVYENPITERNSFISVQ